MNKLESKLKNLRRFTILYITWIDSYSSENIWVDPDDYDFSEHSETACAMQTIGFYCYHDKYNIFVTNSINAIAESIYGCLSIPISAILELKEIKMEEM